MKKTALVIMAAGIGSRFGKGIKQLTAVGPNGEVIMDYSIRDAIEAGFDKIVFIIRRDILEEFRNVIGDRYEKAAEVAYAFQELSDLPEGFFLPEGRTKPWGTGQAVLAARDILSEPFAVINADDYYGKEAFRKVHDYLTGEMPPHHVCMAGFRLKNTLSDHGGVTRGICHVQDGVLTGVTETHNIFKVPGGAEERKEDGTKIPLNPESLVSMNFWGFPPEFLQILSEGFVRFLTEAGPGEQKKEYLLPVLVDTLLQKGILQVDVLESSDQWFGVTYQEDKAIVREAFLRLHEEGIY